jgi:chemotaxis protein CheZ
MEQANEGADRLTAARALVAALEADDAGAASDAMSTLRAAEEDALYAAVGETARQVHDEIAACLNDPRLVQLAHDDAPDARARLGRVIELTQDSAHRTLDAVERARGRLHAIGESARIGGAAGIAGCATDVEAIDTALGEILMAQEYQDLSGQLVGRAIALIEAVEWRLVELLRQTGGTGTTDGAAPSPGTEKGEGPAVPGLASGEVLTDQQQVDDLLADLGF